MSIVEKMARDCDWPSGRLFTFMDDPGEHNPCYVVMPDGACIALNHHARPGVDIARAKFIIAACNAATGLTEAQLEGLANGTMVVRPAHKAPIGDGDWFWRQMDPDDAGDNVHEALRHVPDFVVCHIGASYSAGSFFAARVKTLSDDDDDTEEFIAETEQECIRLVADRRAMLAAKEG